MSNNAKRKNNKIIDITQLSIQKSTSIKMMNRNKIITDLLLHITTKF